MHTHAHTNAHTCKLSHSYTHTHIVYSYIHMPHTHTHTHTHIDTRLEYTFAVCAFTRVHYAGISNGAVKHNNCMLSSGIGIKLT